MKYEYVSFSDFVFKRFEKTEFLSSQLDSMNQIEMLELQQLNREYAEYIWDSAVLFLTEKSENTEERFFDKSPLKLISRESERKEFPINDYNDFLLFITSIAIKNEFLESGSSKHSVGFYSSFLELFIYEHIHEAPEIYSFLSENNVDNFYQMFGGEDNSHLNKIAKKFGDELWILSETLFEESKNPKKESFVSTIQSSDFVFDSSRSIKEQIYDSLIMWVVKALAWEEMFGTYFN